MRTLPSRTVVPAMVLLFVMCAGFPIRTASAQESRLSVRELRATSSSVVLARTVKTESYWNDDRTAILTRVTLQVEDRLVGEAPSQIEVVVPGGRIGSYVHEVSDMPSFTADEESIVFVEHHRSGLNVVSGGAQGKLDVVTDRMTMGRSVLGGNALFSDSPGSPGSPAASKTGDSGGGIPVKDLSLDEFRRKLQSQL